MTSLITIGFTIEEASWDHDQDVLRSIRETVFVVGQDVPADLEWDGLDHTLRHFLAKAASGEAVGTARMHSDGHIERMAVLDKWRGQGVGSELLVAMMQILKDEGIKEAWLNAQVQAIPFYERHGFVAEGDVFLDADIPHYRMKRSI
ncbi:GNAT family N-acetyltransferase [Myxococcota bacterium]|nr:GNAT family N-acetyltransferase [Myxococcota bacterium]